MRITGHRCALHIKPELYIIIAVCLLILPIRWIIAWGFAATFHELCHYLAIHLCGGRVFCLSVGANGASMETEQLSYGREFLCAAAGPIGSMLLLLVIKWFPRLALSGLLQAIYNLLPIFPLDGGRAARNVFQKVMPPLWADFAELCLKYGTLLTLSCLSIYGSIFLSLGPMPILAVAIIFMKTANLKIPCKPGRERVQ